MNKIKKDEPNDELVTLKAQLAAINNELSSSEDFILSYIKTLAIVHGGEFNLNDLRAKYGWKLPKVQALTTAIRHFRARGLLKTGLTMEDVILN
jgi:hypothetical protein